MQKTTFTNRQLNNLIEFRQTIYQHVLHHEQVAKFELLDALTANQGIRSFPELSFSPFFRRRLCSAYTAIDTPALPPKTRRKSPGGLVVSRGSGTNGIKWSKRETLDHNSFRFGLNNSIFKVHIRLNDSRNNYFCLKTRI